MSFESQVDTRPLLSVCSPVAIRVWYVELNCKEDVMTTSFEKNIRLLQIKIDEFALDREDMSTEKMFHDLLHICISIYRCAGDARSPHDFECLHPLIESVSQFQEELHKVELFNLWQLLSLSVINKYNHRYTNTVLIHARRQAKKLN